MVLVGSGGGGAEEEEDDRVEGDGPPGGEGGEGPVVVGCELGGVGVGCMGDPCGDAGGVGWGGAHMQGGRDPREADQELIQRWIRVWEAGF